jgi:PAS domain S-box-containing protein
MQIANLSQKLPSLGSIVDRQPLTVAPELPLVDVISFMSQAQGKPVGIITERDIVQFQAFELDLAQLLAQELMSSPLFCLQPTDSLWAAQQIMQTKNIRRLVITNNRGELAGILTQSNLLQLLDPLEMLSMVDSLQSQPIDRATELEQSNQELQAEVTRREQVETQLHRAAQTLEERVVVRTLELARLTEELQIQVAEQQSCNISLEASQQGISDFIENALIGMHWVDVEGNIVWVNQAELNMFGYDRSEYIGQPLINFHVDRTKIADILQRVSHNESIKNCEAQVYRKDGSICDVSIDIHAFFKDGKFIHARCFTRDITEQQAALRERKAAAQKIQEQAALLDIATDAIIVRDLDSQIQFWNNGAESIYGWSAAEAVGRKITQLLSAETSPEVAIADRTVRQQGVWQGELHKRTKTGREVIVESRWTLVRDEVGTPTSILSVDTDITEKKSLEQQFLRAQRLESLGSLASGIAHDLNNVLTPIVGAAQLLPLTLPNLDARNQRLLKMLVESSKRGSGLVKQILTFARGTDGERMVLQVRHILAEIISVARQTFPKSIEIILRGCLKRGVGGKKSSQEIS